MQTKYELINYISELQEELNNFRRKEQNIIKEIANKEKELEMFDKEINLFLKDFNYDNIEIKKVIYDDYKVPFKLHFNYKNKRYFIKEAEDEFFSHEISVYKIFENEHHSIVKVERIITSNISKPVKSFVQNKAYSHYDKKCFVETFINIFGIDFFKN